MKIRGVVGSVNIIIQFPMLLSRFLLEKIDNFPLFLSLCLNSSPTVIKQYYDTKYFVQAHLAQFFSLKNERQTLPYTSEF